MIAPETPEVLVVKLGGAMLTKRHLPRTPDHRWTEWLPALLGEHPGPLCVVHGLGSFGRAWMAEYEPMGRIPSDRSAVARAIQVDLRGFHHALLTSLQAIERPLRSLDPESLFRCTGGRISAGWIAPVAASLAAGEVPVLYGGTVLDHDGGHCILSSDSIVDFVARQLPADRVVWLSDVPGVYVDRPDGSRTLSSRLSPGVPRRLSSVGDDAVDVTGGMRRKLDVALGLAKCGIPSRVVCGHDPDAVKSALCDDDAGTSIESTRATEAS